MAEAIPAIKAHLLGAFVSFKFPHDQRYHRTLELPPKTTLLGFIGAALGLRDIEIYMQWQGGKPLVDRARVAVRLQGVRGRVRDVWKITKNEPVKRRVEKAVITREQLYHPEYAIYVTSPDAVLLAEIEERLDDPVFPLSLGRDDELALVTEVARITLEPKQPPVLVHDILLPFDLGQVEREVDLRPGQRMRPHLRQHLPHRFHIVDGVRYPTSIGVFTFLSGYGVYIRDDIGAYRDGTESEESNLVFL